MLLGWPCAEAADGSGSGREESRRASSARPRDAHGPRQGHRTGGQREPGLPRRARAAPSRAGVSVPTTRRTTSTQTSATGSCRARPRRKAGVVRSQGRSPVWASRSTCSWHTKPAGASGTNHHAEDRLRLRSCTARPTRPREASSPTTWGAWARYSWAGPGSVPVTAYASACVRRTPAAAIGVTRTQASARRPTSADHASSGRSTRRSHCLCGVLRWAHATVAHGPLRGGDSRCFARDGRRGVDRRSRAVARRRRPRPGGVTGRAHAPALRGVRARFAADRRRGPILTPTPRDP